MPLLDEWEIEDFDIEHEHWTVAIDPFFVFYYQNHSFFKETIHNAYIGPSLV